METKGKPYPICTVCGKLIKDDQRFRVYTIGDAVWAVHVACEDALGVEKKGGMRK